MPVVALLGFAAAQAVLFRLYLPHRYTYPLVAFCAIAVAVALRPTWRSLGTSRARGVRAARRAGSRSRCSRSTCSRSRRSSRGSRRRTALVLAGAARRRRGAVDERHARDRRRARRRRADRRAVRAAGPPAGRRQLRRSDRSRATSRACRRTRSSPATRSTSSACRHRQARRGHLHAARAGLRGRLLPAAAASACSPTCAPTTARRVAAIGELRRPLRRHAPVGQARRDRAGAERRRRPLARRPLPYGRYVAALRAQRPPGVARRCPPTCRTFARGPDEVYDIACVQRAGDRVTILLRVTGWQQS